MQNSNDENPLLEPQREKSGSITLGKYLYQYNWALYNAIEKFEEDAKFAVFVELHEDVVFSDSLDSNAQFQFNQIKNIPTAFTIDSITKTKGDKASILCKLLQSIVGKKYYAKIVSIQFVSTGGFSFQKKKEGLNLKILKLDDLHQSELEKLKKAVEIELPGNQLPNNLQFVISDLGEHKLQETVIGKISLRLSEIYPTAHFKASEIYRSLIDDLLRKGTETHDFVNWTEILQKKALTSIEIKNVCKAFMSNNSDIELKESLDEMMTELNLTALQRRQLKKSTERYKITILGQVDIYQFDKRRILRNLIEKYRSECNDSIGTLIELISTEMNYIDYFESEIDFKAAILYEVTQYE